MPRPGPLNERWVIVAIPAMVVVLPVLLAGVILAVKPPKVEQTVRNEVAPPPAPKTVEATPTEVAAAPQPAPAPTPVPAAPDGEPAKPQAPEPAPPTAVASNTPRTLVPTPAPLTPTAPPPAPTAPPPAAAGQKPVDLLASLDPAANAVSGEWSKQGAALRCAPQPRISKMNTT